MKKDLEYIFKKIRVIKGKLESKYPEPFETATKKQTPSQIEEDDGLEDQEALEEQEAGGIDYEQLESSSKVDPALEARDSSDSTS